MLRPSNPLNRQQTIPNNRKKVLAVNPKYFRPSEVDLLIGDPTKSKTQLGWKPQYDLAGLVKEMVASDLEILKRLG